MAFIPYGRQLIEEEDIAAVVDALRSDFLTTGPRVAAFEADVAAFCGAAHGVAVNSGTAALHCAYHALGIGLGDEVIVPPITFAATSNAVLYCGGTPVFADVDDGTLLLDPAEVERKITPRTKAIAAVDYAGQPCDWGALRSIADRHGLALVADSCHAIGAVDNGRRVGTLADVTCFSFHPVKHVTTGEGGMAVTDDVALAERMRCFRTHGINADPKSREAAGTWFYEMVELGFNYRITDMQCALGSSQLKRLPVWLERRRELARYYGKALASIDGVRPLEVRPGVEHAYHLYVVRVSAAQRAEVFSALREKGMGVNVHYVPVHLHPYYRNELGMESGLCPVAEAAYEELITIPLHHGMACEDAGKVVSALRECL